EQQPTSNRMTQQGEAAGKLYLAGKRFLLEWMDKMYLQAHQETYLLTLPEEQRAQAEKSLSRARRLGAVGGPLAWTALPDDTPERFARYVAGGLVEVDDRLFLTNDKVREGVASRVRELFSVIPRSARAD